LSINIALILGACMKPVGVNPILIGGGDRGETGVKVNVDVEFEPVKNILPVLQASIGGVISPVTADGTVLVSLSNLGSDAITVINMMPDYDIVEWHYNNNLVENGATFTLGLMTAIFNKIGIYPVTVIGQKGVERYSMLFYINVGS